LKNDAEIAERLAKLADEKYQRRADFARAIGLSPQNLNKYLSGGQRPGGRFLDRLRDLKLDVEWLMTGRDSSTFANNQIELTQIPVFRLVNNKPKGSVMHIAEDPKEYITASKTKDTTRYGIIAADDSNTPEFHAGEIAIASKQEEVKEGDWCVVTDLDGNITVRRVYTVGSTLTLAAADQRQFPPVTVKRKDIRSLHRIVEKITRY